VIIANLCRHPGLYLGRVTGMTSRLVRAALRLMPARRRDWAEALWAESGQAPSRQARVAWRAGGVRLIAREALLARRPAWVAMLAGTAVWVALVAWPGPASTPATAINRLNGITVLAMLAGLPLLVRWRFGPVAAGRLPRLLRLGGYALVLALTVAKTSVEQLRDNPAAVPHLPGDATVPALDGMISVWVEQSLFLFIIAVYLTGLLILTAQRPGVATATRRAGTGAGLILGTVLFAVAPAGGSSPWLQIQPSWPIVLPAVIAVFGVPFLAGLRAGVRAGRQFPATGDQQQADRARVRQGLAAGFITSGTATLMVTALGTVVIALTARTAWMLHWLHPGQQLSAARAYHDSLMASVGVYGYIVVLAFVPGIGLLLGWIGGGLTAGRTARMPPPGGLELAGADADGP
jgi:hypothetical protein